MNNKAESAQFIVIISAALILIGMALRAYAVIKGK